MKLNENELIRVEGGAIKSIGYIIGISVGGIFALLAGIIDGYMNPVKCRG